MNLKEEAKFLRKLLFKTNKITWCRYWINQTISKISLSPLGQQMISLFGLFLILNSLICLIIKNLIDFDIFLIFITMSLISLILVCAITNNGKINNYKVKRCNLENFFELKQSKLEFINISKNIKLESNIQSKSEWLIILLDEIFLDQFLEKYKQPKDRSQIIEILNINKIAFNQLDETINKNKRNL